MIKKKAISYAMFMDDIFKISAFLSEENITSNHLVILHSKNNYAFIVTYFSLMILGAKIVNFPTETTAEYKNFIFNKVNLTYTIDDPDSLLNQAQNLVSAPFPTSLSNHGSELIFTSGTTSQPKGVELTHEQLSLATQHIAAQVGNTSEDIELLLMPLSHSFGMARMRTTLYVGATLVIGYPLKRLKRVFEAFEKYQITGVGLVPAAWQFILKMSGDRLTQFASQLRYIELGSASLAPTDKAQLMAWFPHTRIVMHYGLTEVSRATFIDFRTDNLEAVGRVNQGAAFRILKDNGQPARDGEVGQIALKAPWMFSGYFQDPSATDKAFIDGYFLTGDLGKTDGEYLYLTGRLKEIINVGGKKVNPLDVERVLTLSPHLIECACFAYEDQMTGEAVAAALILEPELALSDDIINHFMNLAAQHLPVFMRPVNFIQVNTLPKTPSGKLQRHKLLRPNI